MDTKRERLAAIVGDANVLDDPKLLEGYSRDHSFVAPLRPWFVVRPKSGEEVQALVQWANETETPLIPVSSGPPHFGGDTVPSGAGGVIVDLSRMKEIKRIDRRNRMVVIEPGVTYSELEPALAKEGLMITHPLLPRANKSVIASLLERQPTLIPRINYSLPEPLRTCGVVWGSGELCFTGDAGSGPLSLEAQWQKSMAQVDPKGPMSSDLMRLLTGAQGTMGIVIWASVKCELVPTVHKYYFVPAGKIEDLIDFCYKLERIRLGEEVMLLNSSQLAVILAKQGKDIRPLKDGLPPWLVVVGVAGAALYAQAKVEVQENELRSLVQEFGLPLLDELPGVSDRDELNMIGGLSPESYWKLKYKGGCQDIFFLATLDKAPALIDVVYSVADKLAYLRSDIGVYIQPQHHGVSQHVEFTLPFNPNDKMEVATVREMYLQASQELIRQGAYFSRPYGAWASMVYERDATAARVLKIVKQIVDPKNVLNPGKLCF